VRAAPIAQGIEQDGPNVKVGGSIPSGGTSYERLWSRENAIAMFGRRAGRLSDEAKELAKVILTPGPAPRGWQDRCEAFVSAIAKSSRQEIDLALPPLAEALSRADSPRTGPTAVLVGSLVQGGADPVRAGTVILARVPSVLRAAPDQGRDVQSEGNIRVLCMAAVVCLCRSKDLRIQVGARESIAQSVGRFAEELPEARFLLDLLLVLDDEDLVVLHPDPPQGFIVRITGISDNFQLQTLLCGALIRAGQQAFIQGVPPSPDVLIAASGGPAPKGLVEHATFNLVAWDGSWIWNEGKPADIPVIDGHRVVRLEPLPYNRSWNASAKFPGMESEARLVRHLSPDETTAWLTRVRPARTAQTALDK
jgi:hypothetical protein